MFLGTYAPKLDDKGRIILPAKFWDELAAGVVVTRGSSAACSSYSQREFEILHEQDPRGSRHQQASARLPARVSLRREPEMRPTSQRRVTIPANLREYAGLDRDLTVIGAGNRAEIWDTEAWNTYYDSVETDFVNTAEEVIPGLF